ncbi:MAG: tetratricopeptide repeat protein, partial [Anaerolineales bacterium]
MDTRKVWRCFSSLLAALFLLSAIMSPALADIAPPYQPPGANLEPGSEGTQVRMVAETVTIDVQPGSGESLGKAQVTADFTMRNLGSEAQSMAVRFPISANDGRSNTPELKNLQVRVDGAIVRSQRIQGEDPYYGGGSVPWAEFLVTFPTDRDVQVRISYTLEGTGYVPYVSFYYILSTGAGWKDSIGSADLIVRLPYEANALNVVLDQEIGWSMTTPGGLMEGNTIRWHFENLEPTYEDNLDIALVMPALWQKILNEQSNVDKNPGDGEAWGRLGKLYKEIAFLSREMRADPAGSELYRLSIDAYERCLDLKPNDADWHAGYAELYYMHYNLTHWENPDDYTDVSHSLELLKRAVEINPRSAKTLELLQEFEWNEYVVQQADGSYDFSLLTATPTARVTATSPPVISPTHTAQATDTPPVIQLEQTSMPLVV